MTCRLQCAPRRALGPAAMLVVATLAASCASRPTVPPEPAQVAVEVVRGGPGLPPPPPPRVAVLLDASASMDAPAATGVTRFEAARTRAAQLVESLPQQTVFSVEVVGAAGTCDGSRGLAGAGPGTKPENAAERVRAVEVGAEGSVAQGLQSLRERLAAEGGVDGVRVVAFTDLEESCGGNLCQAVETLLADGASVDLVVLGERPTPECVATMALPYGPPASRAEAPPQPEVVVRSTPVDGLRAIGFGQGDGRPITVAPGNATVEVALVPPLTIGPVTLPPGALVRIRVLDFPSATPPLRDWSLEVLGSGGSLAGAPPSPSEAP